MRRLAVFLFFSLFGSEALAGNGASVYSPFGIGDLRYYPNARSAGMGFTGIGLPGSNYINSLVPAAWTRINRTRIEGSFLYEGLKARDDNFTLFRSNGTFNGLTMAIPLSLAHGIVFGAGFMPYSNVNFKMAREVSQQGLNKVLNDEKKGGLEQGMFGISYAPLPELALGAAFNYMFGTITDARSLVDPGGVTPNALTEENLSVRGVTVTLSGMYTGFGSFSDLLRPLSLGFVVTSRGSLIAEKQFTSSFTFLSEADSSPVSSGRLAIPLSFGVGAGYQIADRFVVAADYFNQAWGNADLFGRRLDNVRNTYRVGVGGERLPSRDPSARWLDRLAYRLGFAFNATYYSVNGQPINEWLVTAGFGVPLFAENRLNIAVEYGSRGTTKNNLVKDSIVRVSASLNLSELWFVRYEEE